MRFIWDETKNQKLLAERGLSFAPFAKLISENAQYAMIKNPVRPEQWLFIVPYDDYTYVLLYVVDAENNVVLKTIYPSRKYHKQYGGHHD
jgi:uncharacterized DUF497 family protein